jgi:aminoglycoside 6'-N-acetyltransferase I
MAAEIHAPRGPEICAWKRLRALLWPQISKGDNDGECARILADAEWCVLVSEDVGILTGFVEASLRRYADGCDTSPVGFVEGWFVVPEFRRRGIGRQLVSAVEEWARDQGCLEMASDSLLDDVEAQQAHLRMGYQEVERAVRFRKDL